MADQQRRDFLRAGTVGAAALGLGQLLLPDGALPTADSGEKGEARRYLKSVKASTPPALIEPPKAPKKFAATEDNILGPYYRAAAPYRAKITPPLEPGEVIVVRGRVWGIDTRKPLAGAVLDIWQANAAGRYDNDDPKKPPKKGSFHNRARLMTDASGYYEFETIRPGRYKIGPKRWRPSHIHYAVRARGYKTLVTQLYFKGDPENKRDDFIKSSLIIDPAAVKTPNGTYELGTFDIVLASAKR